ncbi:uncharacterized protein L969DRAFT_56590 [Mixia osmundae IAM 14324]|uniref:GPI inositol-deacylase n=1 Tax=Mixia osmundae (strain CBS 9802 / IAM 14324 / JCM 22182 / KY 12970) TaxID=764103 RepID=G7E071_MIXOS|nr:uncharacterized protein L969DRAFT_56590 [Mixia osmundae IAM 14324]KEI42221.1 hypothetical protein L969DRAFT_56590 [Mixia osmundae IAM 14324]GAA96231.1 hypothetical protein E5Q_02895 [Mixia osmundae IAM 14324]
MSSPHRSVNAAAADIDSSASELIEPEPAARPALASGRRPATDLAAASLRTSPTHSFTAGSQRLTTEPVAELSSLQAKVSSLDLSIARPESAAVLSRPGARARARSASLETVERLARAHRLTRNENAGRLAGEARHASTSAALTAAQDLSASLRDAINTDLPPADVSGSPKLEISKTTDGTSSPLPSFENWYDSIVKLVDDNVKQLRGKPEPADMPVERQDSVMQLLAGKQAVRESTSFDGNSLLSEALQRSPERAGFATLEAPTPTSLWQALLGSAENEIKGESDHTQKRYMDDEDQQDGEPAWSTIKERYDKPRYPMVFAHGLFGFDKLGPKSIPHLQISYWRGVKEALEELGVEVLVTTVPASASIETRARALAAFIEEHMKGREINLIGHSMGGLDCRFLVTHLQPTTFTVKSITTIATPHRGSPFADYLLHDIVGKDNVRTLQKLTDAVGIPGNGDAYEQLTTGKMAAFNEETPNREDVQYFSYGAAFSPGYFDIFRLPWSVINREEGPNDGLVSVSSSNWGNYRGTLENVNHLDLVGHLGRIRYAFAQWSGHKIKYKPISFYLHVAEMLHNHNL